MRIVNNPTGAQRAYRSQDKLTEKITSFPVNRVSNTSAPKRTQGIVIDISDYAMKIKAQNKTIMAQAVSDSMTTRRMSEIQVRIKHNLYMQPVIAGRIADKMIEEAQLMSMS
jgi:isochorismate hydrolase